MTDNHIIQQLTFPDFYSDFAHKRSSNERSVFSDSAFAENKKLPIHRWVPWIAGFASSFVRDILANYGGNKITVLDPFCGVGTTLVESMRHGHQTVGFEINPYPAMASSLKTRVYDIDTAELSQAMHRYTHFCKRTALSTYTPKSTSPAGFKTRAAFYSPNVLRKVLVFQDYVNTITPGPIRDLFRLAFVSTMVQYSNYSYEPSLSRRKTAGKPDIDEAPVFDIIFEKLTQMLDDIALSQRQRDGAIPQAQVINDTFVNHAAYLEPESIDLIITSPPYLNNYHYNRNTRPQLYWLGYAQKPHDLKPLEHANFGKYWQTVRDEKDIALDFDLPGSNLPETLQHLRTLNTDKGVYGGSGWANYAAAYFNDCYRLMKAFDVLLQPNGSAFIVIGNSILQGVSIPTDSYIAEIATQIGLHVKGIHVARTRRVGNSIIQSSVRVGKPSSQKKLYEVVIELQKR